MELSDHADKNLCMNLSIIMWICVYDNWFIQFTLCEEKRFAGEAALLGILDFCNVFLQEVQNFTQNLYFPRSYYCSLCRLILFLNFVCWIFIEIEVIW